MDGLGAIMSFTSPAVGANWSTSVPVGKRWRLWGGSALLTTSATAGNRNPFLTFQNGNTVIWAGGQNGPVVGTGLVPTNFVPPSAAVTLYFDEAQAEMFERYLGIYLPIHSRAIWLPAGTLIKLTVQNLAAGDALTNIGFLVEEAAA